MVAWLLEAGFYAALGAGVLAINWRRPDTRIAAAALLLFSLVSSVTFFTLPFDGRVFREMIGVTLIGSISSILYTIGDAKRPYQAVLVLAAIDIAFCGVLALHGDGAKDMAWLFGPVVNGIYLGMCVAIAVPGARDAYLDWISSIDRVRRMDSEAPDLDWALRNIDS